MSDELIKMFQALGSYNRLSAMKVRPTDLPLLNIAYSKMGVDLALASGLFKQRLKSGLPGFYVDIGCAAPIEGSNTYLLYSYGWSGLCIDANPKVTNSFARFRPRDIIVHAAVSDHQGIIYWAKHKTNIGMSSVNSSPEAFGDDYHEPIQVSVLTFAELFARHVPQGTVIEFMSMDIEGTELGALRSNDWDKYRPRHIFLETIGIDPEKVLDYPTISYLRSLGYKLAAIINDNALLSDAK